MNFPLRPEAASNFATEHDQLFFTITALTIFFTVVVLTLVVIFAARYRAGSKYSRANASNHNTKLEITWSVIPLLLGLGIFVWGAKIFVEQHTPPKEAMELFVIGKQWMWHVQHPNGVRENNTIHLPLGRPVRVTMISQDVIHALYIPEFRIQYHVVPGRYTTFWFTPTKVGKFHLFCNMYCGTQHAEMGGYVYVQEPEDFEKWLENDGTKVAERTPSLAELGKALYDRTQCGNCHGQVDNVRAPSLVGLYGRQRQFTNGMSGIADDSYLRDSILNPNSKVVKGYREIMPQNYKFTEEQILQLSAYIKSLGAAPSPNPVTPSVDAPLPTPNTPAPSGDPTSHNLPGR